MKALEEKSLAALMDRFPSEQSCADYIATLRWPNGPVCPKCGKLPCKWSSDKRLYCSRCHHNFSVQSDTFLAGSNVPLRKWFMALWLWANHPKGISSIQLSKDIGVTQLTAWRMLKKIRESIDSGGSDNPLSGEVEADETFIGGLEKNKHYSKKNLSRKVPILGVLQRGGEIRLKAVHHVTTRGIVDFVDANVVKGSTLYTDELPAYRAVRGYHHKTVNHTRKEYKNGKAHTNSIESAWSTIKRAWKGTYHWWSKKHMDLYVSEFQARFNMKDKTNGERVTHMLRLLFA